MKKILLTLMLFSSVIFANSINWVKIGDALNSKENKPIFVFVSASNCSYCYKAKHAMEGNDSFVEYVNKNFIPVYLLQGEEYTPEYLYSAVTPTFYVINKNGEYMVPAIRGFISLDPIVKFLNRGEYSFKEN